MNIFLRFGLAAFGSIEMKLLLTWGKLLIASVILAACSGSGGGVSSGDSVSNGGTEPSGGGKLILATNGGTITSGDGKLVLTIPPGALREDTTITIRTINNIDAVEYQLLPDGLTFSTPINAALTMDQANAGTLLDENGNPLDILNASPGASVFLVGGTGEPEMVDGVSTRTEEGSSVFVANIPISHFTSMISATGNSYYVYMTSLGTHYVGSDFKADVTARYLGYETTSRYQGRSIRYLVRSITVNRIKFDASGVIKIVSPAEITRSDFLSRRGQESATRPKFNCDSAGDGTVQVTVDVTGIVEVEFQPENVTRIFTINQSETTTRKGKCIAPYIGRNDTYLPGGEEGVRVALNDPAGDTLVDERGTVVPVSITESYIDIGNVYLGVVGGNALEANVLVGDTIPASAPSGMGHVSYNLVVLNGDAGAKSSTAFEGAQRFLTLEANGEGSSFEAALYGWDGSAYQKIVDAEGESEVEAVVDGNSVGLLIQLGALGLTADLATTTGYRIVSQLQQSGNSAIYFDEANIEF